VPPRFHAPTAERVGDRITLPSEEAEHLARVLRLATGATVRVFNGRGDEFDAVVGAVTRTSVEVRLLAVRAPQPEARVVLTLAQAVLKGDKMDDVVRDAVMVGVARIQPFVAVRSETTLAALRRGHRHDRWQRVAVSSAKQSGRAVVPVVEEPRTFDEVVASRPGEADPGLRAMFVEPSASVDTVSLSEVDRTAPTGCTIFTGPEGGWTPEELALGAATCRMVTLGRLTLRADTMALVGATALFAHWGQL
jgi:16S rRNA (uracil1498-N3)-methyltransferase